MLDSVSPQPPAYIKAMFDEQWYLQAYPDIAEAVEKGNLADGLSHFLDYGYAEGRKGCAFDADWYLKAYPLAARELEAGLAASPPEHFATLGAARGYLQNRSSERPENAAKLASRFGGLWFDAPNGRDLIEGRLEIGSITRTEAEALRQFRDVGYTIIEGAIPDVLLDAARRELERAYEGGFEDLKFECPQIERGHLSWRRELNDFPAKALDLHMFSSTMRNLIFADKVKRFLNVLFDCNPLASQTLGFLRGSAQSAHQDSAYVVYSIARQFAASWIALEDVTAEAGELFYFPGSHQFDDYLYGGRFKSVFEAQRANTDPAQINQQIVEHVELLPHWAEERKLQKQTFLARAGDVLIWHADLVHGGLQVSKHVTRKSVVTHYCPRFVAPLFMEEANRGLFAHHSGAFYTTAAYPGMWPQG